MQAEVGLAAGWDPDVTLEAIGWSTSWEEISFVEQHLASRQEPSCALENKKETDREGERERQAKSQAFYCKHYKLWFYKKTRRLKKKMNITFKKLTTQDFACVT